MNMVNKWLEIKKRSKKSHIINKFSIFCLTLFPTINMSTLEVTFSKIHNWPFLMTIALTCFFLKRKKYIMKFLNKTSVPDKTRWSSKINVLKKIYKRNQWNKRTTFCLMTTTFFTTTEMNESILSCPWTCGTYKYPFFFILVVSKKTD